MPEPKEDEVKEEDGKPSGETQPDKDTKKEDGDGEETINVKKSEYEKTQEDRDTYRDGVTKLKVDNRQLKTDLEAAKGGGNDDGGGDGGNTSIDETKVKEISTQAAQGQFAAVEKSNDNRAQKNFLRAHPEYVEDEQWTQLMSHFTSKKGKATVEDIMDDMDSALILEKRESGTLEEYLSKDKQRRQPVEHAGAGGLGDRAEESEKGKDLSDKGKEIAQGMHVDPEKAKDSDIQEGNVIDPTKPRTKE